MFGIDNMSYRLNVTCVLLVELSAPTT